MAAVKLKVARNLPFLLIPIKADIKKKVITS